MSLHGVGPAAGSLKRSSILETLAGGDVMPLGTARGPKTHRAAVYAMQSNSTAAPNSRSSQPTAIRAGVCAPNVSM